jgi:hypothetical protein
MAAFQGELLQGEPSADGSTSRCRAFGHSNGVGIGRRHRLI